MSKLKQMYDGRDATAVALPQYREAESRPYRAGDYTRPSPKAELRQLDRPPSLEFQLMTAGENYDRGHDFFKEQFDRTGITDAAAESRDFYDNELYLEHPALAAVGSTLAGEAFDFWREAATDPINVATAGMGAAPRAALGSGVRSGTLHRAAKLAKAVDDAQMGAHAASEAKVTEEYVKALRGMRAMQRERASERGAKLADFEASEPLHMTAIASALEDGLGRNYDTYAIAAFPKVGIVGPELGDFSKAFGYERKGPMVIRGSDLTGQGAKGSQMQGVPLMYKNEISGGAFHTLIDADGAIYGGKPAKLGSGVGDMGLGAIYGEGVSPFNPELSRGITTQSGRPGLLERLAMFPEDDATKEAWALLQDRANAGVRAYNEGRVGGIAGARKWDSGVPWEVRGPAMEGKGGMFTGGARRPSYLPAEGLARQAQEAYAGPSLIKMYKK